MNIVIPMAGEGRRFRDAGYTVPKFLLPAHGKSTLQWSVDSLPLHHCQKLIFVCLRSHLDGFNLENWLRRLYGQYDLEFIYLDAPTGGQAETVLAARGLIDNETPLLIFNIDTKFYSAGLSQKIIQCQSDGILGAFPSSNPQFSYAAVDEFGRVVEVAEKIVISENALTGMYHFSKGSEFVRVATSAIASDKRHGGEFYIAPLYQELINAGGRFEIDPVVTYHILGTPKEYEEFVSLPFTAVVPMNVPKIVITKLPINRVRYLDWLVTGFGQLSSEGKCEFKFDLSWEDWLSRFAFTRHALKVVAGKKFKLAEDNIYWLEGVVTMGGRQTLFAYDIRDEPWQFGGDALEKCDLYFKAQHPTSVDRTGFPLSSRVHAAFDPIVFECLSKIRPAMLGRPLRKGLNWKANLRLLKSLEALADLPKKNTFFGYFGTDKAASACRGSLTDSVLPSENPNLKRKEVVRRVLDICSSECDVGLTDTNEVALKRDPIPDLTTFLSAVAQSQWNINVSGIGLSIPFRFVDSFIVGCGIVSDNLKVSWKRAFTTSEVLEFGSFGYEPIESLDWTGFEKCVSDCLALSVSDRKVQCEEIKSLYQQDWSPRALAEYVLTECQRRW